MRRRGRSQRHVEALLFVTAFVLATATAATATAVRQLNLLNVPLQTAIGRNTLAYAELDPFPPDIVARTASS